MYWLRVGKAAAILGSKQERRRLDDMIDEEANERDVFSFGCRLVESKV